MALPTQPRLHSPTAVILCILALSLPHRAYAAPLSDHSPPPSVASLCNTTTNSSLCLSTLSLYPSSQPSALLQDLTAFIVSTALVIVNRSYSTGQELAHLNVTGTKSTLQDCLELMDDSRDELTNSLQRLSHLNGQAAPDAWRGQVMDVRVWLSAALTDMDTCWEELEDDAEADLRLYLHQAGQASVEPLLSMALTMAEQLQQPSAASTYYALPNHHRGHHRRRRSHAHSPSPYR